MSNHYTYSARDVEEAKAIRREFVREEPSDIEKLRMLREEAEKRARIPAMILGVLTTLVFGGGFCLTLMPGSLFVLGIVIGVAGLLGMASVYPLYSRRLEKEKSRVAEEVMALSESIINR